MTGVALVTGGQRGIGFGISRALCAAGFCVAMTARSSPDDPAVAHALAVLGPTARYYRHDMRDIQAVPALLDAIEADLGALTTFVSNAGVSARRRGDMLDIAPEDFDFVQEVNLRGAFFLAQDAARRMLAHPSPKPYRSLHLVTSVSAAMVSIERAEYCISKAGASMMARAFAVRLAPHGIGVFELRPGIVETGMTAGVKDSYTSRIEAGLVPACRWGQPEDIGEIIVPLACGRAGFATGAAIPVDGGLSIPRL